MIVFAKAAEGRSADLARWYDERHIPDLLSVPGLISAERHTLSPVKRPPGTPEWEYMLIYEIEGDDPMVVLRNMGTMMASGRISLSDALESTSTLSLIGLSQGRRDAASGDAGGATPRV
jgi:hypothetical protein